MLDDACLALRHPFQIQLSEALLETDPFRSPVAPFPALIGQLRVITR
jgi:hypothetical protein